MPIPGSRPPELSRKPAPPPMQVILGDLIYDSRNPPVAKIARRKAAEAAAWGFIFGCFALAAALVAIGLGRGS